MESKNQFQQNNNQEHFQLLSIQTLHQILLKISNKKISDSTNKETIALIQEHIELLSATLQPSLSQVEYIENESLFSSMVCIRDLLISLISPNVAQEDYLFHNPKVINVISLKEKIEILLYYYILLDNLIPFFATMFNHDDFMSASQDLMTFAVTVLNPQNQENAQVDRSSFNVTPTRNIFDSPPNYKQNNNFSNAFNDNYLDNKLSDEKHFISEETIEEKQKSMEFIQQIDSLIYTMWQDFITQLTSLFHQSSDANKAIIRYVIINLCEYIESLHLATDTIELIFSLRNTFNISITNENNSDSSSDSSSDFNEEEKDTEKEDFNQNINVFNNAYDNEMILRSTNNTNIMDNMNIIDNTHGTLCLNTVNDATHTNYVNNNNNDDVNNEQVAELEASKSFESFDNL